MKKLRVELGDRSYPILIGDGLLSRSGRILAGLGFDSPPVVVTNNRVQRLHGAAFFHSLRDVFGRVPVIRIGDGEHYKNQETLSKIHDGLFRARADRHSWIMAFGGGVVGDVAGFAAATFMRGIRYVSVPTTLLAQVDSAVGGKTGINVPQGKNLIGAFHQPSAVLADTGTLRTLPVRDLASGLYEVVKCGAIRSESLLRHLDRRLDAILRCESPGLERAILESVRIKAEIVAGDERESSERMLLNFGHTIGHALEAAGDYRRFLHGEAVAWGMIAAGMLSRELLGMSPEEVKRLLLLIRRIGSLPALDGISPSRVLDAMRRDKKFRSGGIRMILLQRLGRASIVEDLDPGILRRFLSGFLSPAGGPAGPDWAGNSRADV